MTITRLTLALAALAALLSVQLAREWDTPPPELAPPPPAQPPPLPPPPTLATPPVERYAEMVARPLFSASRRPVAKKVAQATAHSPIRPPEARLVGVLLTEDVHVALVAEGTKAPRRMAEGQLVDGWTIAAVEPRRVLLRREGLEHELLLAKPKAPGPGPARRQPAKR